MASVQLQKNEYRQEWLDESESWLQEIAEWKREIEHAISQVRNLDEALQSHRHALEVHLLSIATAEQALQEQALLKAAQEHEEPGSPLSKFRVDKKLSRGHEGRKAAHATLRARHKEIIECWAELQDALKQM